MSKVCEHCGCDLVSVEMVTVGQLDPESKVWQEYCSQDCYDTHLNELETTDGNTV